MIEKWTSPHYWCILPSIEIYLLPRIKMVIIRWLIFNVSIEL